MDKSFLTKQHLIDMAIANIATRGCLDDLSIREVTGLARVSCASIRYHFGNREGFLNAVWKEVSKKRIGVSIQDYYESHRELLRTRDGQRAFITGMVEDYAKSFRPGTKEDAWKYRIFFCLVFRPGIFYEDSVKENFHRDLDPFCDVCREISGADDPELFYIWFLTSLIPLAIRSSKVIGINQTEPEKQYSKTTEARLITHVVQNLLINLKLLKKDCCDPE